ncbi:MAG: ATP-binding protein [Thermoanaerobaculia bacterium]
MSISGLGRETWRHIVQFYEGEDYLYSRVGTFLGEGIESGEPVIVIATEAHRRGFEHALRARGIQVDNGHAHLVTMVDAPAMLPAVMRDAMPDEALFRDYMAGIFESTSANGSRARVYGELVDLLWRSGNPEAAIRLEEMWNALADERPFSLLCAYPMGNFLKESDAARFERICREHAYVVPTEKAPAVDEEHLAREIALLQQQAEALKIEVEHRRELQAALQDALAQRRRDEEDLRRLYEASLEATRVRDEFFAIVSHELRTPLTAIFGWAKMLRAGEVDPATTDIALETIARSATTLGSLIDDLLEVSQQATGKIALRTESIDLAPVVVSAVQTVRLAADARAIRLDVQTAPDLVVNGDPTRLQQVVWNLVSNAIKFSEPSSVVRVTLERSGSTARIVVADDGIGITSQFLPHVFEPFRQADHSAGRVHGGLGLGLAIVKYCVELHGGSVRAASEGEGRGSTFVVTLPLAAEI